MNFAAELRRGSECESRRRVMIEAEKNTAIKDGNELSNEVAGLPLE